MPNENTFERLVGANSPAQGINAIPSLALASNVETLFVNQLGNPAICNVGSGTQYAVGATTAPSFGVNYDGFAFKVRAAFKVSTTTGASTAIIAMYANQVGTTITSGNKVATITSQSLSTASASGVLEAYLIWDNVSQKLSGAQSGFFGTASPLGNTALTNTAIAITSLSQLNFSLTANLGSNVAATFTVTEFCAEAV